MRSLLGLLLSLFYMVLFVSSVLPVIGTVEASTVWSRTYGRVGDEEAYCVVEAVDGGYVLVGYKGAYYQSGQRDVWLVKTDRDGDMVWNRTYGGPDYDVGCSVDQTVDGGYIIGGYTSVFVKKVEEYPPGSGYYSKRVGHLIDSDVYLLKTDGEGNLLWNRTYSGREVDYGYSVQQTVDGGYIIAGKTKSYSSNDDFWLIKTDPDGNLEWDRTYGGTEDERAYSVQQTVDGGYIVAGYTTSYGSGSKSVWLVKTDANGNMEWNHAYGGPPYVKGRSVQQTVDGGYIVAGGTETYGVGHSDGWLVKVDPDGNLEWNHTYGGTDADSFESVQQTVDGSYILAGYTCSFGTGLNSADFWLVKIDGSGNMLWNNTYGGKWGEFAHSVVETSDGGYALTGYTKSFGAGGHDFWLIKVDYSAPHLTALSPVNVTYSAAEVRLNFTVNEPTSWTGYSLDGQENVTITGKTTLTGLSEGTHCLTVYANDTAGNMGVSETIYFTVDTIPPIVSILSPENQTYPDTGVDLNFTVSESVSWVGYSSDGGANVTLQGNTTLTGLSAGPHYLTVYANDTVGNMGAPTDVYFTVEGSNPPPSDGVDPATFLLVGLVVLALVLVGAVYTTKIRS